MVPKTITREDARIARTRAALRSALLDLLDRHPFPAITAAMIADTAGVGYATFFRRYADPRALLLDVADTLIEAALTAMAPSAAVRDDAAAMRTLADFVAANRGAAYALLIGAGAEVQQAVTTRAVARAAEAGRHPAGDIPSDLALRVMVAAAFAVLAWWLDHAPGTPPDRIATLLLRLAVAPARG